MMETQAADRTGAFAYTVDADGDGSRADVFIASLIPAFSRSRIQNLLKNGEILVNDRQVKNSSVLEEGDVITCEIQPPARMSLEAYPMDLDVVYEDDCLLVINKPRGLIAHPSPGSDAKTLVHGLLARCPDLSGINGVMRPGIVHRLDKDTSGLMVVAKTDEAHRSLAGQIQDRTMIRKYIAVVWGLISEPSGLIDAPIGRDPKNRQRMAVISGGREAQTSYTVLDRLPGADKTTLLCELRTGRTHQIRVHMKFLGYPVVGDPIYGRRKDDPYWPGQALHAYCLGLRHPVSGRDLTLFAGAPPEYAKFFEEEGAANALAEISKAGIS